MRKVFWDNAWEQYLYWQTHDKKILDKINTLLKDIGLYYKLELNLLN